MKGWGCLPGYILVSDKFKVNERLKIDFIQDRVSDLIQGDPYVFSPYVSHERACAATWLIHHFELLLNAGL